MTTMIYEIRAAAAADGAACVAPRAAQGRERFRREPTDPKTGPGTGSAAGKPALENDVNTTEDIPALVCTPGKP